MTFTQIHLKGSTESLTLAFIADLADLADLAESEKRVARTSLFFLASFSFTVSISFTMALF